VSAKPERIAVYPGSFDPITIGHMDIITRAAKLFDKVVVLLMINSAKKPVFSEAERIDFIKRATTHLPNVTVDSYSGLLVNYAEKAGACAIVRGLRAVTDFEYEFQMALTNKELNPEPETIFLTTSAANMYISSSMVREIASFGGDVERFLPAQIAGDIISRLTKQEDKR